MRALLLLLALTALGSLAGLACVTDPCEARTRCLDETRYEWCNVGADSETHRTEITCKAPNTACVQRDETSVVCVRAPATQCEASFVDRCEGSLRIYCDENLGWVQAVDCTALNRPSCSVDPSLGRAVCD